MNSPPPIPLQSGEPDMQKPLHLQQIRERARLAITQETHSRVPKTCRQEPYSERTVWVICMFFACYAM